MVATRAKSLFGSLLVVAAGFGIIIQALINMGVAVNLLPVTGQTLPLLSAGGSSIWTICAAIGIVQSVSRYSTEDLNQDDKSSDEKTDNSNQITDIHEQEANEIYA